jgi:hypothetical protein
MTVQTDTEGNDTSVIITAVGFLPQLIAIRRSLATLQAQSPFCGTIIQRSRLWPGKL